MSANFTIAYPRAIVTVTDRRLTSTGKGVATITERSTKLTAFRCADARGTITYNGIGWDDSKKTPSQWLMELDEKKSFSGQSLDEVLASICRDTQQRIEKLSTAHTDRRHTFVVAAWRDGTPSLWTVSNYEDANSGKTEKSARSIVSVDKAPSGPGQDINILGTGAVDKLKHAEILAITNLIKTDPPILVLKDRCVKLIKDIAYRQNRKGTVGTSVQWVAMGPHEEEMIFGLEVPGGTTLDELPNLLGVTATAATDGLRLTLGSSNCRIKDVYIERAGPDSSRQRRFDPTRKTFVIPEPKCMICGGRIPDGYRRCPSCDGLDSR